MAIAVTARHSGTSGTSGVQSLTTNSVTPTADSLLLIFWGAQRESHTTAEAFQTPAGGGWTYTQVAGSAAFQWDATTLFAIAAAMYRADVGGSPAAHTVTVDSWSGTQNGTYSAAGCDITGHNTTTPVVQSATNGGTHNQGNAEVGTVTLASAPAVGNVVVVGFSAGNDGAGAFAAPTIGGQAMTQLHNGTVTFTHAGLWYRVIDGTETNSVITCSDLGQQVGNYAAVAVEIAAAGGGSSVTGTIAGSLPALTGSVTGALEVSGSAAGTLPALAGAMSARVEASGSLTATLPAITGSLTATLELGATLAGTLPALTGALTGNIPISGVQGSLTGVLPALTGSATGTVEITATVAATLPALTAALTAEAVATATFTATLPSLTGQITGELVVTATITGTLPAVTGAFTATVTQPGEYDPLLDPILTVRPNLAAAVVHHNAAAVASYANSGDGTAQPNQAEATTT